jgi:hypothetical protein
MTGEMPILDLSFFIPSVTKHLGCSSAEKKKIDSLNLSFLGTRSMEE